MSSGFAISGSSSRSNQSSSQRSGSTGDSSSSASQRFDPLAQRIRSSLYQAYQGQDNPNGGVVFQGGGGEGQGGPQMSADQVRANNQAYNDKIGQMNLERRQKMTASSGLTGPPITIGDVYSPQQTAQMLNLQESKNNATTQAYDQRIPQQLSGRGFAGAGSPLAVEMQRRADQQNQANNSALATQFPFQIAKENADHRLAAESAAQGFYRQMQSEAIARQQNANQAGSTSAQERIAKVNADQSGRNALLQALTSLAQPLNKSKSRSLQDAYSVGGSSGNSFSQQSNVTPYSFENFAI